MEDLLRDCKTELLLSQAVPKSKKIATELVGGISEAFVDGVV